MMKLNLIAFAIMISLVAYTSAEDIVSASSTEEKNCDSLVSTVVDQSDNGLTRYIARFDLAKEFAQRNEGNELCFNYVTKLLAKIAYYKEAASLEEANARNEKRAIPSIRALKSLYKSRKA